jgi:hypothetical protein
LKGVDDVVVVAVLVLIVSTRGRRF